MHDKTKIHPLTVTTLCLVVSLFFLGSAPSHLKQKIMDAARVASLDPKLVEAIIKVESNFQPKVISPKGAMGLMQVMPSFADECGISSPFHTVNNLMGACKCLRILINRYRGNLKLALAAYNAGPSKVTAYKGVPPIAETKNYIKQVMSYYKKLKTSQPQ